MTLASEYPRINLSKKHGNASVPSGTQSTFSSRFIELPAELVVAILSHALSCSVSGSLVSAVRRTCKLFNQLVSEEWGCGPHALDLRLGPSIEEGSGWCNLRSLYITPSAPSAHVGPMAACLLADLVRVVPGLQSLCLCYFNAVDCNLLSAHRNLEAVTMVQGSLTPADGGEWCRLCYLELRHCDVTDLFQITQASPHLRELVLDCVVDRWLEDFDLADPDDYDANIWLQLFDRCKHLEQLELSHMPVEQTAPSYDEVFVDVKMPFLHTVRLVGDSIFLALKLSSFNALRHLFLSVDNLSNDYFDLMDLASRLSQPLETLSVKSVSLCFAVLDLTETSFTKSLCTLVLEDQTLLEVLDISQCTALTTVQYSNAMRLRTIRHPPTLRL